MPRHDDLDSLRNLVGEAQHILATSKLPERRAERAYELLTAAVNLIDSLLEQSPAATLGKRGGKQTAKRGSDYFRKIGSRCFRSWP